MVAFIHSIAVSTRLATLGCRCTASALRRFSLVDRGAVLSHFSAAWLHGLARWLEPTSFTRSGLEKRFLELVLAAGLPQPRINYVEHGFELDRYWPEYRFAVELDVFETHGTRAAFERDRKRQEDLLLRGIAMIRVTGPRLEGEPEEVVARVARLLSERGRYRASSKPSGV